MREQEIKEAAFSLLINLTRRGLAIITNRLLS